MNLETTILFEVHDNVCGCTEVWDSASGCPRLTQTPQPSSVAHSTPEPYSPFDPLLRPPHSRPDPTKPSTPPPSTPDCSTSHSHAMSPPSPPSSNSDPDTDPLDFLSSLLATPPPRTSGPPRETCFFRYHGHCRAGNACTKAHEHHITWPISIPTGFVHFRKCELTFCPLRDPLGRVQDSSMPEKERENDGMNKDRKPGIATEAKTLATTASSSHTLSSASSQEPETCFFWYHGNCRRADACPLAHEVVGEEMVKPPPRYNGKRHVGCHLALCPFASVEGGKERGVSGHG
ncbi:uncharacterized protein EI97DRAFT_159757 [Westerdykella ornata]|uniref:C3H1-type domain-containing protein n=1 Tax=Westerdykella ornata TaxID=318751 RepID=A0A6A6JDK7_WESOR|nr:uncharacterized protein EI97DRAFT_159757 [Westerdykella ornata]KAF2273269.1 hypothetical protein EI97DRAFT_159757 [Westerdykella ornata]